MSSRVVGAALFLLAGLVPGPLRAAADGPPASGSFASGGVHFAVGGAFAFPGKLEMSDQQGIVVTVSNAEINGDFYGQYYDRPYIMDHFFKSDERVVVHLLFARDGRYVGLSYYLGPGNGCGFCSAGRTQSNVKLTSGKVVGTLKLRDKDRQFEITLNAPVYSDNLGTKQGPGGGAAGKAYLAYHAALVKRDAAQVKKLLVEEQMQAWEAAAEKHALAGLMDQLAEQDPTTASVTDAFENGERALVLIAGRSAEGKVRGEVLLHRQGGAWKVYAGYVRPDTE